LSVRVLPIARVAVEDRYTVNKVGAVEGFYTCTYYLGYRDDFDVRVADVVERIADLEHRSSGDQTSVQDTVDTIRRCAAHAPTHIVPHYYVSSLPVTTGPAWVRVPINWVRRQLIENVYRHLAAMFPETKNWLSSADEIIHVGINATI
jgi:KUP system potassium uptake protein